MELKSNLPDQLPLPSIRKRWALSNEVDGGCDFIGVR